MVDCCFFCFKAEDGIRDDLVTGVQTCALPIYRVAGPHQFSARAAAAVAGAVRRAGGTAAAAGRGQSDCRLPTVRGDRKSVVQGKSVDLGGRRIIKKKKEKRKMVKQQYRKIRVA